MEKNIAEVLCFSFVVEAFDKFCDVEQKSTPLKLIHSAVSLLAQPAEFSKRPPRLLRLRERGAAPRTTPQIAPKQLIFTNLVQTGGARCSDLGGGGGCSVARPVVATQLSSGVMFADCHTVLHRLSLHYYCKSQRSSLMSKNRCR